MVKHSKINQLISSYENISEECIKLAIRDENDNMENMFEVLDFKGMIEDYLIELEIRNYSKNTIKTYKSVILSFYNYIIDIKYLYNEQRFLKIFKLYIQHLKRERYVSQNYIYLVTVVLKKFLEFHSIYFLNDVKSPKRSKSLPKSLNEIEVQNLINAVEFEIYDTYLQRKRKLRNKLILALLYSSGLRVSELINLSTKDIDLRERTMRIKGKGEKDRIVLFDEDTKNLINKYIILKNPKKDYLFLNRKDEQLTPRYIQMMIKSYADIARIRKTVTPHILRHSFATHLLKNGVDIRVIQQLLGHSNLSTTQIYTSVDMETLKNVYDKARTLIHP
jgi:integrase/recombinase XerD